MPSVKLHPTDIILHKLKLNWCVLARSTTVTVTHRSSPLMWVYSDRCNKNRDPLERVKFFKRFDDQTATSIDRSKLTAFDKSAMNHVTPYCRCLGRQNCNAASLTV